MSRSEGRKMAETLTGSTRHRESADYTMSMEEITANYKNDAFGKPIEAHIFLPMERPKTALPIALIFHLGGFLIGSAAAVPKAQTKYLMDLGFAVMIPNYRLAPQVPVTTSLQDSEDAYEFAVGVLPGIIDHRTNGAITLNPNQVVAMGHSSGGTIALHLASCKPVKAVTAFYPSLFLSATSTSAHKSATSPPFSTAPVYNPSAEERSTIFPPTHQISSAPLAIPGQAPTPRNKFQLHLLKTGSWLSTIQPDGHYAAIDPLTRISPAWPPVMLIQGESDNVPGSSLELAQRAEREMLDAGMENVKLEVVAGQGHVFDLAPGAEEPGDGRWIAVVKGLEWLWKWREGVERKVDVDGDGDGKGRGGGRGRVPQLDVHIRYV